jgi:FAD/FMN-containing dehydrogenase
VGAGCTLGALLRTLRHRGLTLPTLGAITRQTVAGAVATATHGSGEASLSNFVREMRIATYRPATGEPFVLTLSADSADPTEQAELRAARCSLGYLGVVLSLRFECERRYAVEEELALVPSLDDAPGLAEDVPAPAIRLIPCPEVQLRRRKIPDERPRRHGMAEADGLPGHKLGFVDVGIHGAIKLFGARSWDSRVAG